VLQRKCSCAMHSVKRSPFPGTCLAGRKKCGAVPLTKAPLYSGEVRQEVPVGAAAVAAVLHPHLTEEAEGIEMLKRLEALNGFYCDNLDANGFDGLLLRLKAPTRNTFVAVTQVHSQARVEAIKKAKTAGQMFFATGGRHTNSNEFFQARALADREARSKELETRKKLLSSGLSLENDVTALLTEKGNPTQENARDFTVPEVKKLVKWKNIKPTSNKKADLIEAFENNPPPLDAVQWTVEEEMELVEMQSDTVELIDTAVGVATTQMARAVMQNLGTLDAENRAALMRALMDNEEISAPNVL
jgi:hypothetical protein